MRFIDYFDRAVRQHPDRLFLVDGAREVTYLQAQRLSHRIANALRRDGVARGAKVAIYSQNSIEACLCAVGALRAGCVWATFDVADSAASIADTLTRLDVEALFYSRAYEETCEQVRSATGLTVTPCIDGSGALSLEGWLGDASDAFSETEFSMSDLVTLFGSGGTTGKPKGVMASHLCWELGLAGQLGTALQDAWVQGVSMPITHVGGGSGLLFGMAVGVTLVLLPAFDPDAYMSAIERRRIAMMMLPPTALSILLSHPRAKRFDKSSLKGLLYVGAPTPVSTVLEAMDVLGPILMTGFAQTETTAAVTALTQKDHVEAVAAGDLKRLESCGRPQPLAWIEIMDEEGGLLPPGEIGEIVIRCSHLMLGYYKAPEETREAARFGWHHTGDVGFKDERGYVYLVDRKRDMIITRGFNVFPAEIERAIGDHPAVRECAVVGAPDAFMGEAVKAVVALHPGRSVTARELAAHCTERVGALMTPTSFEFWPELPKSRAGKVLRRQIRETYWQGRERKI